MSADLIVFGEDWGAHPSSTQHLIHHMPGERRVVWVNSIGLRRPRFGLHDARRAASKVAAAVHAPPRARGSAVTGPPAPGPLVQPLVLPMAQGRLGRAVNRAALARSVGRASRTAGLRRPVLWVSLPSAVDAVGALGEAGLVYYCGDDFGALAGVDHAAALAFEAELAERADLILAASPTIAARFPAERTHLLEHGVDFELFSTPVAAAPEVDGPGPVAGFYGALAPWIDIELLAEVARLLPDWRFVFIGPRACDVSALTARPNVSLLGPRPHGELPAYAQHWTAGLIPFRDIPQIRACNPLKLREYLAAGRPVVATDFPALGPYRGHIRVVSGPSAMAEALEAARLDGSEGVASRRAVVAQEGWSSRAAFAATLIDHLAR
jgi:glycosyltransferase involved in cell wall biosynthesis